MGAAIIYATGLTKTTKNVADYIARSAKADIFNLKQITLINMAEFDTIVFGTGAQGNKPMKPVLEFIEKNKSELATKKVILFATAKFTEDKEEALRNGMIEASGIDDVILINMKTEDVNEAGIPSSVDSLVMRL